MNEQIDKRKISVSSVIALTKDGLSSGPLESCSVVPAEAVLSGKAVETGAMHHETENGKLLIGTWECTPYAETLSTQTCMNFALYCLAVSR